MSIIKCELRDIDLGLALMQRRPFKLNIVCERHTYRPKYSSILKYGDLFLFKSSPGGVVVGRAIELKPNAYETLLVPKKSNGTEFMGSTLVLKHDVICRLVKHERIKEEHSGKEEEGKTQTEEAKDDSEAAGSREGKAESAS